MCRVCERQPGARRRSAVSPFGTCAAVVHVRPSSSPDRGRPNNNYYSVVVYHVNDIFFYLQLLLLSIVELEKRTAVRRYCYIF